MSSLLLRNLRTILTCDDGDAVLEHADLYCENGIIRGLGPDLPQTADTVIDGSHYWCYPGLINTHHHLYQVFSRNLPQVQNLELFDWLKNFDALGKADPALFQPETDDSSWQESTAPCLSLPVPGRYMIRATFDLPETFSGKLISLMERFL